MSSDIEDAFDLFTAQDAEPYRLPVRATQKQKVFTTVVAFGPHRFSRTPEEDEPILRSVPSECVPFNRDDISQIEVTLRVFGNSSEGDCELSFDFSFSYTWIRVDRDFETPVAPGAAEFHLYNDCTDDLLVYPLAGESFAYGINDPTITCGRVDDEASADNLAGFDLFVTHDEIEACASVALVCGNSLGLDPCGFGESGFCEPTAQSGIVAGTFEFEDTQTTASSSITFEVTAVIS